MKPLVQKVKKYIKKHELLSEGEHLLIACSGGADSVALVRVMVELQKEYSLKLGIVHTDHQLRGEESAEDMLFVEKLAEDLQLPFYGTKIEVPKRVVEEGGNVQVICREERYAYFETIMETYDYSKLVLGHHADDQVESVLMTLTRGALNSSITGIPLTRNFSTGRIIRPFLCITKKEIEEYVHDLHQGYRHDPSNDKNTYTRNRIRHKVVPFLLKENPQLSDSIKGFVEKQQQDDQLLQAMTKEKFDQLVKTDSSGTFFLNSKQFAEVPVALQRRLVLLLLNYLYNNSYPLLNDRLIESILTICNEQEGNAIMHLPNAYFLVRHYEKIQFTTSHAEPVRSEQLVVLEDYWQDIGAGFSICLTKNIQTNLDAEKWYVQLESDSLPLTIRQKEKGDRILIKGMDAPKKVSRIFIDEKISSAERLIWPVLVNNNNDILAVVGIRYQKQFSKEYDGQNYAIYFRRQKNY